MNNKVRVSPGDRVIDVKSFSYHIIKKGYELDGFYYDSEFTKPFIDYTPLYEDTTLYLKWREE